MSDASLAEIDDRLLMRRHVEGDAEAFGEIYRRHRDRMWAVALRTTRDPEVAADAVQDAFLNAFRRAGADGVLVVDDGVDARGRGFDSGCGRGRVSVGDRGDAVRRAGAVGPAGDHRRGSR